jgi:inositol phosphorylceramide synthase catalytic subunit
VNRFAQHVGSLWGRLWLLPLVPALYALVMLGIGDLRWEHVAFGVVAALLGLLGPRSKQFFIDATPYMAVAIGYDLVRYVRPLFVTADRVLGCGLRDAELALFSAAPGVTFQDLALRHHLPALDLLFAVPYTVFVYVAFIYAGYLFFADRRRMRHYLWAFAIGNYISFTTWLLLPAAPPWYLRAHGCAIDVAALPSPAGLARVDELLGIGYYAAFYSRASSVFGALPSMHCAYPLIGLLTAWRANGWRTRPIHIVYTLVMACGAVYLDHHWVIDVVAGWGTALVAVMLADRLVDAFYAPKPVLALGLAELAEPAPAAALSATSRD